MKKMALPGAALMMLVVGGLHLFAPQMMMRGPGIELTSANHFHVIRAAYGGAYMAMGVLFALGWFSSGFEKFSLASVTILFSGFAIGRCFSLVLDGQPAPLYLGVLCAEVFFAVLSYLRLHELPQQ